MHRNKELTRLNARRDQRAALQAATLRRYGDTITGADAKPLRIVRVDLYVELLGVELPQDGRFFRPRLRMPLSS
jgi:hypothetical protein